MNLKNENIMVSEFIPKELTFHSQIAGDRTDLLSDTKKVIIGECSAFKWSFIKVSIASTAKIILKVSWKPSFNFFSYTNFNNFTDPTNLPFDTTSKQYDLDKVAIIPKTSRTFTIDKNTYRYFVLPVEGEIVAIEFELFDNSATNEDECRGVSIRCCLSNNFHYVSNS